MLTILSIGIRGEMNHSLEPKKRINPFFSASAIPPATGAM
jgi:hypothetical protein